MRADPPAAVERISVIFTARDDPWLPRALAALGSLQLAGLTVEVVVVLHASPAPFVERVLGETARLDLDLVVGYLGPGTTIGAARNSGADLAAHDTLLFLDSDCVLRPEALQCLRGRPVRVANGPVDFVPSGSAFSRHNCALRDVGYRALRNRLPYMPNLLVSRDVFRRVGGFRGGLSCGEDFELGDRLVRAGERPEYLADLRVDHLDDQRVGKTFKNWFRNGWGAGARRHLDAGRRRADDPPALVTPRERLRRGPGYAVVSCLGAAFLTAGYLTGRLANLGRSRSEWALDAPRARLDWVRRSAARAPAAGTVGVPGRSEP